MAIGEWLINYDDCINGALPPIARISLPEQIDTRQCT